MLIIILYSAVGDSSDLMRLPPGQLKALEANDKFVYVVIEDKAESKTQIEKCDLSTLTSTTLAPKFFSDVIGIALCGELLVMLTKPEPSQFELWLSNSDAVPLKKVIVLVTSLPVAVIEHHSYVFVFCGDGTICKFEIHYL